MAITISPEVKNLPKQGVLPECTTHSPEATLAQFKGELVLKCPHDLYIPPKALQLMLEAFEGPLDLLLYLIKKNNMDILDIRVAVITDQYMNYIKLMATEQFELAAEYLVMAATLAEIKSRVLLPRPPDCNEEEETDPRAELIRRLQEYEQFKEAAQNIDALPRIDRDIYEVSAEAPEQPDNPEALQPTVYLDNILFAMARLLQKDAHQQSHHVQEESLSVREQMIHILSLVNSERFTAFTTLVKPQDGRMGIIVTFIAIMELLKDALVEIVQSDNFAPIHVKGLSLAVQPNQSKL